MTDSTKNNIATAVASVLIIGASAGTSIFGRTDDMQITHEAVTSYSFDSSKDAVSSTTDVAEANHEYTEDDISTIYVYVSSSGKYHARSDCSGMKNYVTMSLAQAVQDGNLPCGRCYDDINLPVATADTAYETEELILENTSPSLSVEDAVNIVYVSASGKYHTRSDCSGMKHSTEMDLDEAISSGYSACKKCAQ